MAWTPFTDDQGQAWEVDQDRLYLLLRANVRASLIMRRTRIIEHSAGWFLPTTYECATDWSGLRGQYDVDSAAFYCDTEQRVLRNASDAYSRLVTLVGSTRQELRRYEAMRRRARTESEHNVTGSVENWEMALYGAEFVRDTSATILVVGAGTMSGGAALGVLGAGSALRGTATYQRTGNVGAAVVSAAGTFIVGAIGIGPAGSAAAARSARDALSVLVLGSGMSGMFQGVQSLVEGQTGEQAVGQAVATLSLSLATGGLGGRMQSMGIGVRVTVGTTLETASGALSGAVGRALGPPAANPTPSRGTPPSVQGYADYADIPLHQSGDSAYVSSFCLRRAA
jgi:hypothetical protein